MLDLFTIFSKGGIVLWYFQGVNQVLTEPVNALIKTVILQERGNVSSFQHGSLTLEYKLDNEFELIFVVAYQKILQLSYIDKFIDDVRREFRDKYAQDLRDGHVMRDFDFTEEFQRLLKKAEASAKNQAKQPRQMRTFEESQKSQKSVASLKVDKKKEKEKENVGKKKGKTPAEPAAPAAVINGGTVNSGGGGGQTGGGGVGQDTILRNREEFFKKMTGKGGKKNTGASPKPEKEKKKGKAPTKWANGGSSKDAKILDFSGDKESNGSMAGAGEEDLGDAERAWVGSMSGELKSVGDVYDDDDDDEEEEEEEEIQQQHSKKSSGFGVFNMFKGLVGQKTITAEAMAPVLDKMRDHLIGKNVAADIADQLCTSVATKLEGRVLGTFSGVTSTIRQAIRDSLVQILTPKRRIDILRDVMEAKSQNRPYTITFCGVNGVGKSTNLAKICFWLVENGFRVLIAACDTFRAGAVEQLRTHARRMAALHPPENHGGVKMVQLYEKGYGKDAAGIAMEAINFAREQHIDVVLVDTAGRMQDNEPLMRALSKLIKVNQPELVLFVGEALVGNDSVDQLTKFNQALADFSSMENPRLIDGILLTKFDTIDDKVGASISMTYTTGQPVVFVGTGQTYTDLKALNVQAVVNALLK
ncbi:PREDICTED: signal recognition particle receptor subunit alpha-like isoform X2 [Branchiostoma belcheri]|uniref:Signal recognition particle receptor subunit alpha-like isoform X1 n=1 Tax=Branchiostoma belcheri TaxID=7741 RepID=A0A6P4ZNG7_BRABE|nr:PREDICTED: signal recognition particle receptor subunit alpha-like isoform X1 [Branchiostoma belcheri]XP_019642770.1 PREDICTED: signal recognition particle receptor subunit alpha-like isoform X2 [Branchiostoma belcheri]